ncbi:MAG: histidine--tRNA ligase [Gemmatimonadota bacterium]|nr:MAG: histidine--tRNA ligase [Gemmatimonadota bacterium]
MKSSSLPGFRDFYPEEFRLRQHILSGWREVARRYGFIEYDGPPLEPLELYTAKSGDEIVEQLYSFTDKGGRAVALRPEMTPTLARMVGGRAQSLPKPIKWFSVPQLFRYERPQRGRLREHFQLNMDIVGETDVAAEAELVAAAVDVLRHFGLDETDFVARVSDRRLVSLLLREAGVEDDRLREAISALDRSERQGDDWLVDRLTALGLGERAIERVLGIRERSLAELAREYGGSDEISDAIGRLQDFFRLMDAQGLADYVAFDLRLVRGLAYYTGLVFELWERSGRLRAICGGGRYDGLLAALGGPDLPALGFGLGDVVLGELLKEKGLVPEASERVDDFVIFVTAEQRPAAIRLARQLRERGRSAAFDYRGRTVGRQFRAADQVGASRAIVIGPEEERDGTVSLRDMETGAEGHVPLTDLLTEAAPPDAHPEPPPQEA